MNSTPVRFVHRPLPDEGSPADGAPAREPLIDRDRLVTNGTPERKSGWFGAFVSRVFRVRARKPQATIERNLDDQRWLPKE